MARREDLALAALVVLVPLLWHLPYFSGEALLYDSDAAQVQYPRYRAICDALQGEHAVPLWQTAVSAGSPLHGNPETPTLYPPVLAFALVLGPIATMNATILLHLALAALGMYLLVLRLWERVMPDEDLGVARIGAAFAALAFTLGVFTRAIHVNLITYGAAIALMPWMLWAAEGMLFRERPARWAGILALLAGAEVLTGGLFVIPYALWLLVLWVALNGLFGGAQPRRRALVFGALATVCAVAIGLAKFLPYREWVATTTRSGKLFYDEALGNTLASRGMDKFEWSALGEQLLEFTGGGVTLLLALPALFLIRRPAVRWLALLALLFFLAGLSGPVHRFLYEWVPPFDRVRNAIRAWTGVNLLLSMLAGLGASWLATCSNRLRASSRSSALLAGALVAALSPLFALSSRDGIQRPQALHELLARYERWPDAALRCGKEWRAFWLGPRRPGRTNEQFVTSALGVETVAGYLGNASPALLERHVYGEPDERLLERTRKRRLGALSVRWLVTRDSRKPESAGGSLLVPAFVDGTEVTENQHARPRAFVPSCVVGVRGDVDDQILYALLDDRAFPLQQASLVVVPEDEDPQVLESLFTLIVARGSGEPGSHTLEVALPLDDEGRKALHELALRVAAAAQPGDACTLEREASTRTRVTLPPSAGSRWVVVSEPWSIYDGWKAAAAGSDRALPIRRADGVSSAVLLSAQERELRARFAPRSTAIGLVCAALGLAGALALILWPRRDQRAPTLAVAQGNEV